MDNVFVYLIDFDTTKVTECVTENEDGTYSIFINAKFDREQQLRSYNHAVSHILNEDFKNRNADRIEYERH